MSRIRKAFAQSKAFIAFVTAGDPTMEKTEEFILSLAEGGADLIEIGIPFSDPVAEGETIQRANIRALSAGATTDKIFAMVESVRKKTDVPLVFLTYINPVFTYGTARFFEKCEASGVDGVIIPDLPFEEKGEIAAEAKRRGVEIISLIAPTSAHRIGMIAKEAQGFVYLVSSLGVTGVRSEITTDLQSIVDMIRQHTKIPVAVGFGIATPAQGAAVGRAVDGVIVGSAIVRIIAEHGEGAAPYLAEYAREMKAAIAS